MHRKQPLLSQWLTNNDSERFHHGIDELIGKNLSGRLPPAAIKVNRSHLFRYHRAVNGKPIGNANQGLYLSPDGTRYRTDHDYPFAGCIEPRMAQN